MSQDKLRNELADILGDCRHFIIKFDRNNPVHQKLDRGFALLVDDNLWNGPTGQNNED